MFASVCRPLVPVRLLLAASCCLLLLVVVSAAVSLPLMLLHLMYLLAAR
jgi:hypothetical protein